MSATAALIIGGIVSAASAIGGGIAHNKSIDKANKESKDLAFLAREDEQKQVDTTNKFNREKFNYEKMMNREVSNKQQLGMLGTSLDHLSAQDKNMTNFVLSLYGNVPGKRTGI